MKTLKNRNKIIDLFSGVGGLSLGFEMAGFETSLAIDSWKDAISTFNHNRINKVGLVKDVHDFSDNNLLSLGKNVVGIVGGPPCQGFSMVGTRDHKDKRNSLYLEFFRFVKLIKPKFFLIENVKGLLTLKGGYFKKDIVNRFSEIDYNVFFKVLKASDYGIPQRRERVFFVGLNRNDFGDVSFDFPRTLNKIITTKDALSDLPSLDNGEPNHIYKSPPQNNYQKLMRKGSSIIYNNDITNHTSKTINIINKIPDGGNIKSINSSFYKIRNYNTAFKRMNSCEPSITIDTGHRNYFHYSENRVPTVRESARLQSFPDTFEFIGSKTSQYIQVGNAVPPLLSYSIARKIKPMIL